MKRTLDTKKNYKILSSDIIKNGKLKQSLQVSNLLKKAIDRYQFDIVGWTEYCTDNKTQEQKALLVYHNKPFEDLRMRARILSPLSTTSIKKVYESKSSYIKYLDEEYVRDKAFYEAILKNPGKYKTDLEDDLLNEEINKSAKKYLKSIKKRKIDEETLIKGIKSKDWIDIKNSKYPKVMLGLILGASKDAIINNFGLYFINQLKAQFAGSRTAYLSSSGPTSWHEIERVKAELTYFKKEVINPIVKKLK